MALSAQEQAEMDSLNSQVGHLMPGQTKGLTSDEQAEMQSLQREVGHISPQAAKMAKIHAIGDDVRAMADQMYPVSKEGPVQSTLSALPAAGAQIVGTAGFLVGGVPLEVAGSGVGSMVGRGLQDAGERYLLGKKNPSLTQDDYAEAAKNGMIQGGMGAGMRTVGGAVGKMGFKPSANAPQVKAAADKLKVKPTQGMLTDNYTARNTENSLSQQPTIPGQWVRNQQAPVYEAQQNVANKATADANTQTPNDAGRQIKKSIVDYVDTKYVPQKEAFQDIRNSTQNVDLNEAGRGRIAKNIGNIDEARFSGSPGEQVARQFQGWLSEAQSVDDIAILRTKAQRISSNPNADPEARAAASEIYDKLDRYHDNSIKRGAVDMARGFQPTSDPHTGKFTSRVEQENNANIEGMAAGKDLLNKIDKTRGEYGDLMNDLNTIGKNSGLFKPKAGRGPETFKNSINATTNENVAPALFDSGNVEGLRHLQKTIPQAFEISRQQELNSIVERAAGRDGKVDPVKLQRIVGGYSPEVQDMLFGNENVQNLKAAKTLQQATPPKIGASDTPRGIAWSEMFTPSGLLRNVNDLGSYGLLKARGNAYPTGQAIQKYASPAAMGLRRGLLDER